MNYPEKEIYTEVVERIKDNTDYIEELEHVAPAHYDMDHGQYNDGDEGEKKTHPWDRIGLFFLFGDIKLEQDGAYRKKGIVPLTITIAQDKYVDSADGADNQADYLKLQEYKWIINDIIEYWRGSCFGELHLVEASTDRDNKNLHIERLQYQITMVIQRKVDAPA